MLSIETIEINSLAEYLALLDKSKAPEPYFRGQREDLPLLPKIARQAKLNGQQIIELEKKVFNEFLRRGRPFFGFAPEIKDDIELLTIGQHYGLPTRLLDWTTNPLAALWFAIRDVLIKNTEKAVVWIYNPSVDNDAHRTGYANGDITDIPRTLHFKPVHVDQRLIVQKSVFTIHGSGQPNQERKFIPLENERPESLMKIMIPSLLALELLKKLEQCGIDGAGMFPGLEGVCCQIGKESNSW